MKGKILIYTMLLIAGGLEKSLIEYLKLLKEKGYDIDLIVDYNLGEKNIFEELVPKGIDIVYVKPLKLSKIIYKIRNLGKKNRIYNVLLYFLIIVSDFYYYHFKVKKIVKKNKYATIITFFQFLPSYITNQKNSNHIIFLHGSVEHYFVGIRKYFKKMYLKKLKKYNHIVTVCKAMKMQLQEIYPELEEEKVKYIYTPLDFEEIEKKSKEMSSLTIVEKDLIEEKYMVVVCRIDEGKDIVTLIRAYEKLVYEDKLTLKLYIVGTGSDEERLKKIVKSKKLEKKIIFIGVKINPYVWIKKSEFMILASKNEGFGLVILESLILNTPVISSNCKVGPSEILEEGKYGDLFGVGDVEMLAGLIRKNINNKKEINYSEALERFGKEKIYFKIKKILK